MYYSHCCGKPVEHIGQRNYVCSRCGKSVTVYGNPKSKEERDAIQAEKKKRYKQLVQQKGEGYLYGYPVKKVLDYSEDRANRLDSWVLISLLGNVIGCVEVPFNEYENFVLTIDQNKICAIRLSTLVCYFDRDTYVLDIDKINSREKLLPILQNLGWRVSKSGKIY